jgi:formylglycine-generating enzyme required for sulfatase activity
LLAYHAALPLVLTPELLNYLRNQFLRGEGVPWVAEADLLLSDLSRPVGYEQYAMDTAVRAYLLEEMEQVLGNAQMKAVARVLISYVQQLDRINPYISKHELRSQQWAAMVYLDDRRVARELAKAYQDCVVSDKGGRGASRVNQIEMAQLSRLVQELEPQLRNHPVLLDYAKWVGQLWIDPAQVSAEVFDRSFQVENIELRLPTELLPDQHPARCGAAPRILTFEFEVATIEFESLPNPFQMSEIDLQPFEFEVASIELQPVGDRRDPGRLRLQEILRIIDEAVFAQTGQHLTHVQLSILEGSWDGESYKQIAEKLRRSFDSTRNAGSELWSQLSQVCQQKVTKQNVRTVVMQWLARAGEVNLIVHRQQQQGWQFLEDLGASALRMVAIQGGSFLMGSPEEELERSSIEGPQHTVTVRSFLMGKYPVNQGQWRAVAALPQVNRELNLDPSRFKGENRPVECVSWYEAVEFCDRLSQYTGKEYRLPSEAEWEYACLAGTTTPFHFGETITTDLANYCGVDEKIGETLYKGSYGQGPKGVYREETTEVGSFPANAFGLYDMHGNVWEWCLDHWHDSYKGAPIDGSAWLSDKESSYRLLRGGSWLSHPWYCRSAFRLNLDPDNWSHDIGFRVVCSSAWTL